MTDDLRHFVDKRTKAGGFSTPSEYVRHLIREDQSRESDRLLEALLIEGLESGPARTLKASDLDAIRATVRTRVAERAGNGRKGKRKRG